MSSTNARLLTCPCCGGELLFDAAKETLEVVTPPPGGSDAAPSAAAPSLEEVQRRMEARKASRKDAFGDALKAERGRKTELDDLFKDASEKAGEAAEDERPDNPLDDRWR